MGGGRETKCEVCQYLSWFGSVEFRLLMGQSRKVAFQSKDERDPFECDDLLWTIVDEMDIILDVEVSTPV